MFDYSRLAQSIRPQPSSGLARFVDTLADLGPLTAAISFQELPKLKCKELIIKIAKLCKKPPKRHSSEPNPDDLPQDGLRKAAAVALSLGLNAEARAILLRASHHRIEKWSLYDVSIADGRVFSFVLRIALDSAAKKKVLHEKDLVPREMVPICFRISRALTGAAFRESAKERLPKYVRKAHDKEHPAKHSHILSEEEKQYAERFIDYRLEPLFALTRAFSRVLGATSRGVEKSFMALLRIWVDACKTKDYYYAGEIDPFLKALGFQTALFVLWVRNELKPKSVKCFLEIVDGQDIGAGDLIRIVSILAKREPLRELAGEQAIKACQRIEAEDEVMHRASQFGALGRAMLHASIEEASVYYRKGLEQMDSIGSGDYAFTNELLLFVSKMKGGELDEHAFHTLSNVCELNMSGEPSKFPWGAYGQSLSKAAGPRGLAKLSRWDDRSNISFRIHFAPVSHGACCRREDRTQRRFSP